jgi:hypothetical protein
MRGKSVVLICSLGVASCSAQALRLAELDIYSADCLAWNPSFHQGERALAIEKRGNAINLRDREIAPAERARFEIVYRNSGAVTLVRGQNGDWLLVCRLRSATR